MRSKHSVSTFRRFLPSLSATQGQALRPRSAGLTLPATAATEAARALSPAALSLLQSALAGICFAGLASLAGCAVGPQYQRPDAPSSPVYKEAQGWSPATPSDALERGAWWTLFGDATLDALAEQVEVSNQNIAEATANYAQARALVREQRAALFPVVTLSGSGDRQGGRARSNTSSSYQASMGASWEPDVWGRLGRAVSSADASAAASAADLASARLSAQGELATYYLSARQTDAQQELLRQTIAAFQRSLDIAQNRYAAGIATRSDVLQAQTTLANAQAEALGLRSTRAQYEHAIAVLTGQAPGNFTLAPAAWQPVVPQVPVGVPSTLLERRPDIAGAERRVAVANEQIGIAQSAYYPNLALSASVGNSAGAVADLFKASTSLWSFGLSAAQILFDAGAIGERVTGARAEHEAAVARYRQTVLAAFQDVENQLSSASVFDEQQQYRQQASAAADEAEQQVLNRYKAGQVSYTEVVTAQASALSARRALVQLMADRQTTAVALIQALGGGWNVAR